MRDLSNTQLNPEALEILFIIVGAACTGKTTLEKKLIEKLQLKPLEIVTTREKRDDDPTHYSFIDREKVAEETHDTNTLYHFRSNENAYYFYKKQKSDAAVVSFISDVDVEPIVSELPDSTQVVVYRMTTAEENIQKCYDEREYDQWTRDRREEKRRIHTNPSITSVDRDDLFRVIKNQVATFKGNRNRYNAL